MDEAKVDGYDEREKARITLQAEKLKGFSLVLYYQFMVFLYQFYLNKSGNHLPLESELEEPEKHERELELNITGRQLFSLFSMFKSNFEWEREVVIGPIGSGFFYRSFVQGQLWLPDNEPLDMYIHEMDVNSDDYRLNLTQLNRLGMECLEAGKLACAAKQAREEKETI